ncbi:MAG: hypothetical protein AAFN40_17905 [Cyanobacteria bacterium J06560_6]
MEDKQKKRTLIASWSFLLGSLLFTLDSAIEIATQFSPYAVIHLAEGLLFLLGSYFFLPGPE